MLLRTASKFTKLFLALLLIAGVSQACAQVFDFKNSPPQTMSLEGQWRVHPGDDADEKLGWADPAFDDSQWTLLRSSRPWSDQGYKGYSGFAWYRFTVVAGPGNGRRGNEPLGILIPRIRTSYEVFANGKLVGQFGGMPPHGRYVIGYDQIFPIPTDSSPAAHPIVIAIRVWTMDWLARFGGGPVAAPTIGQVAALKAMKTQNDWERFWEITAGNVLMLMNLVAAFAGFFLFWMRPADREFLWFGLYELLTGQPPFTGDSPMAIMAQHTRAPIPRLDRARPGLSPQLAAIVARCLQRNPDDRYPDLRAFIAALDHPETADVSILDKGTGAASAVPFWRTQTATVLGTIALVIVVVIVLAFASQALHAR